MQRPQLVAIDNYYKVRDQSQRMNAIEYDNHSNNAEDSSLQSIQQSVSSKKSQLSKISHFSRAHSGAASRYSASAFLAQKPSFG